MQITTRKLNFTKMSLYPSGRYHMYGPRKCDIDESKASSVLLVDMQIVQTLLKRIAHTEGKIFSKYYVLNYHIIQDFISDVILKR